MKFLFLDPTLYKDYKCVVDIFDGETAALMCVERYLKLAR